MKKTISLLLCAIMLMCALVGCAKDPDKNDETNNTPDTDVIDTTTQGNEETEHVLVPEDFGDSMGSARKFTILVRQGRWRYLHSEDDSSDRVASSAWKRNQAIEELYNIDIEVKELAGGNFSDTQKWITALLGANGEYDLCMAEYWMGLGLEGLLTNILECEEIDLSLDYYYRDWNDNLTVNGKLFELTGDVTNEMVEQLEVIYYNKAIADELQLDLYKLVDEGNWTLEEMDKIIKDAQKGLDDEDVSNNVYGAMYDIHSLRTGIMSLGLELVEPTDNGFYVIVEDQTRNIRVAEEFTKFIHQAGVDYSSATCRSRDTSLFVNGQSLFFATSLLIGERMKPEISGWDYGVVIAPKLDAEDDYYATVYGCTPLAIPKSVKSTHVSATVLDAMNYMGEESNIRSFYDIVLLGQVADKADDVRMIEFARGMITTNIACIFDEGKIDLQCQYANVAVAGNKPISSNLATIIDNAGSYLDTILEKYQ
ncbi:MAG: hypothetical protein IJ011_08305 [Clostridia bacterium]|nr:hypothetical protein [Clostridia bacterium]